MSEIVTKKLKQVQELIEAENYKKGLTVLRKHKLIKKLTPYKKSQIYKNEITVLQ